MHNSLNLKGFLLKRKKTKDAQSFLGQNGQYEPEIAS
jgi:hypothetical protein